MPTEITDPNILAQLNGPQEVTDPGTLAQLNAQPSTSPMGWVKGAGQSALAIGSGALKGVNSALNDLLPGENLQPKIDADPVMNYHPQSPEAQSILGGLGKVVAPIGDALSAVKQDIGSAFGQRTADVTGDLATILGAKGALSGGAAAKAVTGVAPEATAALKAGLKLTPEQAGAAPIGSVVQSLAGSAKLERSVSKSNIGTVNNLAKDDLGLPRNAPLTQASLNNAKVPYNAVYDRVSKLGTVTADPQYASDIAKVTSPGAGSFAFDVPPAINNLKQGYGQVQSFDAGDAVAKVRQLRADASKNIKSPMQPEQNALGYAQRQIADAIEGQLERHTQATSPDLMSAFKDARVQLAKIHSVQDALDSGNVSASALGKQLDKKAPLNGNLKTIAEAANHFPRAFQDLSKIRNSGPFNVLDGIGLGLGDTHPLVAATLLSAPLARAALASKPYQRTLSSPGISPRGLMSLGQPAALTLQGQQQQGLLGGPQ